MPKTPASVLLAAPLKASTLGWGELPVPELGLALPEGLAGMVPLLAGKGAALAGAPLPAAVLPGALEPGAALPGAALPGVLPEGVPWLGTSGFSSALSIGVFGFAV